jgi:L-ascorbate metabolism protein UlaG (beta-lactamase superfamily)
MSANVSHFDGKHFHNLIPRRNGFWELLRWMFSRQHGQWHEVTDAVPGPAPAGRCEELRITFVNHTTFLLQVAGINILTDPTWSNRASPFSWAGPRRFRPPGIRFEDLPPIDCVLLSHDHYDHMDMPTLQRLGREHAPVIYVGLKNARVLAKHGIGNVVELDWWQRVEADPRVEITAVPAQHFSGRSPFDRDERLWCGFVLQANDTCIYFAGDTGSGPHFAQVAERFPEIDLAILPIGAYRPEWFMGEVHMSPDQAVAAHLAVGARVSVASHFGTFDLADDGQDEPLEVLREALQRTNLRESEFWVLGFGEGRNLPARVPLRERKDLVF